jgi:hypothetical protein
MGWPGAEAVADAIDPIVVCQAPIGSVVTFPRAKEDDA